MSAARELAQLARYHAMHDEVSERDRNRIAALCDEIEQHVCSKCAECIHDGRKCCGCYDGVCCQEGR